MKLIIELPDDIYNFIIQRGHLPYGIDIADSIIDGEVVPENTEIHSGTYRGRLI